MHPLQEIVQKQKQGVAEGICSVCSSSPYVIDAAIIQARETGTEVLIEATANQVNQYGGYTGMKPADFRDYVLGRAAELGLPEEKVILGGDHLGPVAWKNRPAGEAMNMAEKLVYEFAAAGYSKIHLDASMPLGDEVTLTTEEIADRTVRLCKASEKAFAKTGTEKPVYVIGSEVPTPGGSGEEEELSVTKPEALLEMLECFREKFEAAGLQDAWDRVVGAVVQPGVEFGNTSVHEYNPAEAETLSRMARGLQNIVLEGHSTDYQCESSLKKMVGDGIAILKVGPALTFAAREALFALSRLEKKLDMMEMLKWPFSDFEETLDRVMLAEPSNWNGHYTDEEPESTFLRKYSYSDRSRYYMHIPEVKDRLERMFANLDESSMPLTLLSQYMPVQYEKVREGAIEAGREGFAEALVIDKVREVLAKYWRACGK